MADTIDFCRAIARNREALMRIVETLLSIAGLDDRDSVATLPRATRNYLLRILRPAESAVRRLIVVAARGVKVAAPPLSPCGRESLFPHLRGQRPRKCLEKASEGVGMSNTAPAFPLIDPRKRFLFAPPRRYARTFPRISIIGVTEPRPIPEIVLPMPDDPLDATRICRRLHALKHALDDLDGQARRLARHEARRKLLSKPGEVTDRKVLFEPMRPGYPPGRRKRPRYDIDEILRECHSLAVYARSRDTS